MGPDDVARAVDVLRRGGVIAYPTDTLYGLGADPRRADAVARIFAIKGRPSGMALPLIAASLEQAMAAGAFGPGERRLADAFWPGPLSIVVAAAPGIDAGVLGEGRTVAVRVPAHDGARALAAGLGFAITATSANRSGDPATGEPSEVAASIGGAIDLLLDDGPLAGGAPSTIVAIGADGPRLVRAGAIAWDRVLRSVE
jgi:L-threonylcarbamoyladenylate synthase